MRVPVRVVGSRSGRRQRRMRANLVLHNRASQQPTALGYGGGIVISETARLTLTNNIVAGNRAKAEGGGLCDRWHSGNPTWASCCTTPSPTQLRGQQVDRQ